MNNTITFQIKLVDKTSKHGENYKACVLYNEHVEYMIGFERDYNIINALYRKNLKKGDKK